MSSDPFPTRVDAAKLFARDGSINAALPLDRLLRLTDCIADPQGEVTVDLQFGHDAEGRRLLSGTLDVPVRLICQRCLEALPRQLHCELQLLVLDTDAELRALPDEYDAIVAEGGELDLQALIEDELLLSLPLVPMHEEQDCNEALNAIRTAETDATGQERPNPFAALAGWKGHKAD